MWCSGGISTCAVTSRENQVAEKTRTWSHYRDCGANEMKCWLHTYLVMHKTSLFHARSNSILDDKNGAAELISPTTQLASKLRLSLGHLHKWWWIATLCIQVLERNTRKESALSPAYPRVPMAIIPSLRSPPAPASLSPQEPESLLESTNWTLTNLKTHSTCCGDEPHNVALVSPLSS